MLSRWKSRLQFHGTSGRAQAYPGDEVLPMKSRSERGGVIGAVLMVTGLMVLAVVLCVVAGGLYIAHNVRVTASDGARGQTVHIETPFGSMRVREDSRLDPRAMGVPVYPGAVLRNDHHKLASVQFESHNGDARELAVVAGEYTTPDPIARVREFYRAELPHWMVSQERHGKVCFSFTERGYKKMIALEERDGITHIALAALGEPAAN
jgi:hypothetical protein